MKKIARLITMTALFTSVGFALFGAVATETVKQDVAIHLTCEGYSYYSGVIVDGTPYHTYCEGAERYSGIIIGIE